MGSVERCGSLRRLCSLRRQFALPGSEFGLQSDVGSAGGFEGSQDSRKLLWAKSERDGVSESCQSEVWTAKTVCTRPTKPYESDGSRRVPLARVRLTALRP